MFTIEFKQEAVRLVTELRYTQQEAAEVLGTTSKNINRWVNDAKGRVSKDEVQKIAPDIEALQKRIRTLELEKEILKKAAAFFAKELS